MTTKIKLAYANKAKTKLKRCMGNVVFTGTREDAKKVYAHFAAGVEVPNGSKDMHDEAIKHEISKVLA